MWSDSTIVLGWIKTEPYALKTFVANRIAKIQELTGGIPWSYVPSEENPANLLLRGTTVAELKKNKQTLVEWTGLDEGRRSTTEAHARAGNEPT